ncbi:hypothetical protein ACS0TY_030472 [Phlomoides rotata]
MLLSGSRGGGGVELNRVFQCKTCNRQFSSFQALGDHRDGDNKDVLPPKPKTHKCSVCGMEFSIDKRSVATRGGTDRRPSRNIRTS